MFAPRARRLRHSASLRVALLYAALFGISALAMVSFVRYASIGLLDRQVEAAVTADAQGLLEGFDGGGLPVLANVIHDRLIDNIDDDALYLLADTFGNHVAGNLEHWPRSVVDTLSFHEITVDRAGSQGPALVRAYTLDGNMRLLVGRDVRTRLQLRHLLTDSLVYAVLLMAALGTIGGLVLRGQFRRMLADVSATAGAIADGDLGQRVHVSGRGDEFDLVAETINDMLDRIARLMDGVRQVSNAIAHDLRTPITRARARLEDATLHAASDDELRAAIDRAVADLDGVTSVFQALLRIAEIEAGSRRAAFAMIDLAPLLDDAGELYEALGDERGITLAVSHPERLPCLGDRDLIQQAVANLLDNAIKFSPDGATVRLIGQPTQAGIAIEVADEGPGMDAADLARATERFFRAETARSTPGSGLGLALVQAVAQLHNGALILASNSGAGLRATLTLRGDGHARPLLPTPSLLLAAGDA